jgi:hypothetical protein
MGVAHGLGLGEILTAESDALKVKYRRRNKLKAIPEKKPHKRQRIYQNNLGRKKLIGVSPVIKTTSSI